ncbi:hypothetical protein SUGI_0797340 [Cryptomeria japonica]|nr:hypothetical protein SUGI_0797340 [Cryptomeria japonica]
MEISNLSVLLVFQLTLSYWVIRGESAAIPPGCFSKIFAFGDSLTDTGNTRSGVGPSSFQGVSHLPYGQTYFHRPTNRYSDGRLVIDFVAQALGLPFLQPYTHEQGDFSHGVNFAVAGSTAIDHDFYTRMNITFDQTPQSLGTQLQWYKSFMDKTCKNANTDCKNNSSAGALYWVGEIGANDYAYITGSDISSDTIRTLAVTKTLQVLETLIQGGASYMVVEGLPLTGCLSMAMTLGSTEDRDQRGCIKSVNEQAQSHNALLQQGLEGLRSKHPNTAIVYADYTSAHNKVLLNPTQYGFDNTKKACCGAGGGTYNFDIFATCGEADPSPISVLKNGSS